MSRIFVSGVAGFMGSHLAEHLIKQGHHVIGIDNMLGGYEDNVPEGVEFHKIDACDFEALKPLMKGVELIFHLASTPHEGLSVFSPNIITKNTYNSTVSVTSAAVLGGVKRLVAASSMARYGKQSVPFTEYMTPRPRDPYGVAKYAAELMLATLCEAHDMEYVIAVPHNVIGPRQKYDDPFRNVASIMINLMLQGRQPFIYGDGKQQRAFSFISDVIDPMIKMGFQEGLNGEVFNIGPDEEFISINELAERLATLMDFTLDPVYVPDRPMEVKMAYCSADKARTILGYNTTYTLDQGLQEMIEWIGNRGPKPFSYYLPIEIPTDMLPITWQKRLF